MCLLQLDFWDDPRMIGQSIQIMAHMDHLEGSLYQQLSASGVQYRITDSDVARLDDDKSV